MGKWRSIAIFGLFSILAVSCGHRNAIVADADNGEDAEKAREQRACGYGLPCDSTYLGGRTCESLGLGSGDLSCDPKTCHLVLTRCGPGAGRSNTGTTTSGTGGTDLTGLFGAGGGAPATDGGTPFFGGLFGDGGFFGGMPIDNNNGDDAGN